MQQDATTLFARLKLFTSVVSGQSIMSGHGNTSELPSKDAAPQFWWICAGRHLVNVIPFLHLLSGRRSITKEDLLGIRSITKGHFFRDTSCAITPTLQRSFNVTGFPLISGSKTVLFTAQAQRFYALFPRFFFQTDRSLTKAKLTNCNCLTV